MAVRFGTYTPPKEEEEQKPDGVLIVYGNGAELGDFGQFAKSYKEHELHGKYDSKNIFIKSLIDKNLCMQYFIDMNFPFLIKEMHFFCHSIGAALYIGYDTRESRDSRNKLWANGHGHITYENVVKAEIGALMTDDFVLNHTLIANRDEIRKKFQPDALIKLWGCNAGVENWVYSDDPGQYYWTALNTKNVPKPSIAQVFANFFNLKTYGAHSGTHNEVNINGQWISMDKYKGSDYGKQIRLHPDKGDYILHTPQ